MTKTELVPTAIAAAEKAGATKGDFKAAQQLLKETSR